MEAQRLKSLMIKIGRWLAAAAAVAGALLCGYAYYRHQAAYPSTNDAYVQANYAGIAAQVSGPITAIHVRDNQRVRRGDLMIEIDPAPFEIAVVRATALVARIIDENAELSSAISASAARVRQKEAELANARDYLRRVVPMTEKNYMSKNRLDDARTAVSTLEAALLQSKAELERAKNALGEKGERNSRLRLAKADLAKAELNLSYTKLFAPCDGYVTNFRWTVGGYVNDGHPLFAVVDDGQWWIYAYFRENQIGGMQVGDKVEIRLATYGGRTFKGKIDGIGYGIFQADGATVSLLPKVSPEVDWVKLAQRFPVRVAFDDTPPPVQLRIGNSAVVKVELAGR
jgi:multidrug resistance efflux pump